jgi:hypothetical protein
MLEVAGQAHPAVGFSKCLTRIANGATLPFTIWLSDPKIIFARLVPRHVHLF